MPGSDLPFDTLLVANRGEIACRVLRTARRLGLATVAVYSEVDAGLPHVRLADRAELIGPAPPAQSYLAGEAILAAARRSGAQAVHPGYGFLAESAEFAAAVQAAGLVWVGPPATAIAAMADKVAARNRMRAAGVPVADGSDAPVADEQEAVALARRLGYPLMVKAAAGGGGIGMGVARDDAQLRAAFATARSRAERFFASPAVFLERYLDGARHVEVQILGLADGQVVALGERDCSVQRRHQKLAEETPSPAVDDALRARMLAGARRAGEEVGYRNAGTVECLLDPASGEYVFLEMNTRLQVEHPVTEMVTGIDLVEQQLRVAGGLAPSFHPADVRCQGHALELRVYAEDPHRFLPSPGTITAWSEPRGPGVRVDAGYAAGDTVTPYYDPLLAKLVVHGADRAQCLQRAAAAVADFRVEGVRTNLPFFTELLAHPRFVSGSYHTGLVHEMRPG